MASTKGKETKQNYFRVIYNNALMVLLLFSLFVMIFSIVNIGTAMHNIDMTINFALVFNDLNKVGLEKNDTVMHFDIRQLNDKTLEGNVVDLLENYRLSLGSLAFNIGLLLLSSLLFGYYLSSINNELIKKVVMF